MLDIFKRRQVELYSFILAAILLFPVLTLAQGASEKDTPRKFGTYSDIDVDLAVKVQGGNISIFRSWQGDKHRWLINPQHEALTLSTAKEGQAFGYDLPKEISRGSRTSKQIYPGVWRSSPEKSLSGNIPSQIAQAALVNSFQYCANQGEQAFETIYAAKDGFKWTSGVERSWAQYDSNGILRSWGKGNYLIGKVLYDAQNLIRGYADTHDKEVITFARDALGRVTKVSDYEGREVNYTYSASDELEDVVDVDGIKTRYTYQNGNLKLITIGDDTNSAPGEEVNDKTVLTMDYSPDGVLLSVTDQDGIQTKYQYDYNKSAKLYTTVETVTGNWVTTKIQTVDGRAASVLKNGEYLQRTFELCEDTAILDQHNALTYIDRDGFGAVRSVLRPDGKVMSFNHTSVNWPEVTQSWNAATSPWGLTLLVEPGGRTTTFNRDSFGRIEEARIKLADGDERVWRYEYDGFGNKLEERLLAGAVPNDMLDAVQIWTYDAYGNVASEQIGINGPKWQYGYNSIGNIIEIESPEGAKVEYSYTPSGKVHSYINPVGYKATLDYSERGLLRSSKETYETGKEALSSFEYNHRGLLIKRTDSVGKGWVYEYSELGQLESIADPLGKTIAFSYDRKGRFVSYTDGNGVIIRNTFFDTAPEGQAPQTELPFQAKVVTEYPKHTEEQTYDLLGRLIKKRLVAYDGSLAEEIGYEYDNFGNIVSITRPDGKRIEMTWDVLNRTTSLKAPGEGTKLIAYTNADKTIAYTDPLGGKVIYELDDSRRLKKQTGADGIVNEFAYDVNGNLDKVIDNKGRVFRMTYDSAQRLSKMDIFPDSTTSTAIRSIQYLFNLRGDLISISDGAVSQSFGRDPLGRVLNESITFPTGFTKSSSYTYAANGQLETETTVDGTVLTYLWDNANQFQGVNIPGKGSIAVEYDAEDWNNPKKITFPGGSSQSFKYDALRRVKEITSVDQVGNQILNYIYSLKSGPSFEGIVENFSTEHGEYSFEYDDAYRLTGIDYPDGSEEEYKYDELNRRQPAIGAPWSYSSTGSVTDSGLEQFTYDQNGNRKTRVEGGITSHYFYDEFDRLIRIEKPLGIIVAEYEYDPTGRRISKTVGGVKTFFYYNERGIAAELDASGNVTRKYLFAPQNYWGTAPLAIEVGGNYYYSHNDHLGTPRKLVTGNGNPSWEASYDAFGKASITTSGLINNLRFPGQYYDAESGLHQNFRRDYDPLLGAYIQQDSYDVLDTGPNRYAYVGGSPTSLTDPTGEFVPQAAAIAIISIGAIIGQIDQGTKEARCNDDLWDITLAGGRGIVAGSVAAAVGIWAGVARLNPALGAAAASVTYDSIVNSLGGEVSGDDMVENAAWSAVGGKIADKIFPNGPGGWNFNLWKTQAFWGPKALNAYKKLVGEEIFKKTFKPEDPPKPCGVCTPEFPTG